MLCFQRNRLSKAKQQTPVERQIDLQPSLLVKAVLEVRNAALESELSFPLLQTYSNSQ